MTLVDEAAARIENARRMGREPVRWIANEASAGRLPTSDELHGVPIVLGKTRFGLELVCTPRA